MNDEDTLTDNICLTLTRQREELRRKISHALVNSQYDIVSLFDLWCNQESRIDEPGNEVSIAHTIREILEALYKDQTLDQSSEKTVEVPEKFPEINIPPPLIKHFTADSKLGILKWKGPQSREDLSDIIKLSESFAYKWGCHLLFKNPENESIESELKAKLTMVLKSKDPHTTPSQMTITTFIQNFHRVRRYFTEIAHSKGTRKPPIPDWEENMAEAEKIISVLASEPLDIFNTISSELLEQPISRDRLRKFAYFVRFNASSLSFFFDRIDHRWLSYVKEEGFFDLIPTILEDPTGYTSTKWPASSYLIRIAEDSPQEVFEIISGFEFNLNTDTWVIADCILCIQKLAKKLKITNLLKKCKKERWLNRSIGWILATNSIDLLQTLIEQDLFMDAAILLEALLDFELDENNQQVKVYLNEYYLRESLAKICTVPKKKDILPLIYTLAKKLNEILLVKKENALETSVASIRYSLFEHEKYITEALIEVLSQYIQVEEIQDSIGNNLKKVLKRISADPEKREIRNIVILKNWPRLRNEAIEIMMGEDFFDWQTIGTILEELPIIFPQLDIEERKTLLDLIEKGPKDDIKDSSYISSWKQKRLRSIWSLLTPNEQLAFKKFTPDDTDSETAPGTTWRGPESPLTEKQLSNLSVTEVIDYLTSWKSPDEWLTASSAGLGRMLANIISENPTKFSADSVKFFRSDMNPTYLYHLLEGFRQAIREKNLFTFSELIPLFKQICDASQTDSLWTYESKDPLKVSWAGVLQSIGQLLTEAFNKNFLEFSGSNVNDFHETINTIIAFPDPSKEELIEMLNQSTEPGHISVNSTQGWGIHAAITFLSWCKRGEYSELKNITSTLLVTIIDIAKHGYHVGYLAGKFLPAIFGIDHIYGTKIIQEILKSPDKLIAYSAWSGYVNNQIGKSAHLEIEEAVTYFIDNLVEFDPPWEKRDHTCESLGNHLANAYLFDISPKAFDTLCKYLSATPAITRGSVIQFIGSSYMHEHPGTKQPPLPPKERLIEFWKERLKASSEAEEFREFGWWIGGSILSPEETLDLYIPTLKKSNGVTEPLLRISENLETWSEQFPSKVLECLNLITSSSMHQMIEIQFRDGKLKPLIEKTLKSKDPKESELALKLKNQLLALGLNIYYP